MTRNRLAHPLTFDRLPGAWSLLVAVLASGCAPEGLACGTIRCEPGQICAPPHDPCDPLAAGASCPGDAFCTLLPSGTRGCYRGRAAGPGLCFDVPEECDDVPDCECVRFAVAPYRCVFVAEDGYVTLGW